MHNKRLYKKLNTLLDIIIMSIPVIYIILFFVNHNFNPITDYTSFNDILISMFGDYSIFGNLLVNLLSYFGITTFGGFYTVAIGIMDFAFCIWCLDMVKDLLMLVIAIPMNLINKE